MQRAVRTAAACRTDAKPLNIDRLGKTETGNRRGSRLRYAYPLWTMRSACTAWRECQFNCWRSMGKRGPSAGLLPEFRVIPATAAAGMSPVLEK